MDKIGYLIFALALFIVSCSSVNRINKLNRQGYALIVNSDTIVFDRLFLDGNYKPEFKVDKGSKTIQLKTQSDATKIISIGEIKKIYSNDSNNVAFIIFNGEPIGMPPDTEKVYFQYSLVNEIAYRIKKGTLDGVGCRPPQGDVLIIR